jgi:hypothetical protein
MNSKQLESEKPKKPYRKPEFIQVALRPEEAVLGYCKFNAGTHGPGGGSNCHPVGNCFVQGS